MLPIFLLSSCVNDDLDNSQCGQGETILSLSISSDPTITKAGEATISASAQEQTINSLLVAIFPEVSTGVYGNATVTYGSTSNLSFTDNNGIKTYKITGLVAKIGNAKILLIANPKADYSACQTWNQFKAITETVTSGTSFSANDLVKVGVWTGSIVAGQNPINIPLSQLAARVDIKIPEVDGNTFKFNKIKVDHIATSTSLLLDESFNTNAPLSAATEWTTAAVDTFSFYTYENKTASLITITMDGTLSDGSNSENQTYSFTLNTDKAPKGVEHGNVYDVKGKLNITTKKMDFTWTIRSWSDHLREVYIDIIKASYLVVKDLLITMPNVTTTSTTFQSSSPVTISNITVTNGTSNSNLNRSITATTGNNGTINITSDLPINFVPKYIKFTVTNNDGLTQDVAVVQYPPLYITNMQSLNIPTESNSQSNRSIYVFKVLVADFTNFPYPDEFDESFTGLTPNTHKGPNPTLGSSYTDNVRSSANLGYPSTRSVTYPYNNHGWIYNYYSVSTKWDGVATNIPNNITNINSTIESSINNNMISPSFILASQNGTNSSGETKYQNEKEFCAGYEETAYQYNALGQPIDISGNALPANQEFGSQHYKIVYSRGTWRVPTKTEVYIIDILQNYSKCEVKRILEGGAYWSIGDSDNTGQIITMMDPRVSDPRTTSGAVRCVRDIK